MKKDKDTLTASNNETEVLEFLKTARTLKRQIKLVRGIDLERKEIEIINRVLIELSKEFALFKA